MNVFIFVRICTGWIVLLAVASRLVEGAVRVERLVVVGADLTARIHLHATIRNAAATPRATFRINVALAAGAAVELKERFFGF